MKVLLVLSMLLLTACGESIAETAAALLANVDTTDGVSRREADKIAEAYFAAHVGCGAYTGISNSENAWVVEGKHGFAGDPIKGFVIDKKTGQITSTVGPSYKEPKEMLRRPNKALQGDGPRPAGSARA